MPTSKPIPLSVNNLSIVRAISVDKLSYIDSTLVLRSGVVGNVPPLLTFNWSCDSGNHVGFPSNLYSEVPFAKSRLPLITLSVGNCVFPFITTCAKSPIVGTPDTVVWASVTNSYPSALLDSISPVLTSITSVGLPHSSTNPPFLTILTKGSEELVSISRLSEDLPVNILLNVLNSSVIVPILDSNPAWYAANSSSVIFLGLISFKISLNISGFSLNSANNPNSCNFMTLPSVNIKSTSSSVQFFLFFLRISIIRFWLFLNRFISLSLNKTVEFFCDMISSNAGSKLIPWLLIVSLTLPTLLLILLASATARSKSFSAYTWPSSTPFHFL